MQRPERWVLRVLRRRRARVEEVEREVRWVDRQRPRRDRVLDAVRHRGVGAERLDAAGEGAAAVVRRAHDRRLCGEVVVGDVDVLPGRRDPGAVVLGRRLRPGVEALPLILRDLDRGPADVEVDGEQVAVGVHRDVLVLAAQRAVRVEGDRLRPRLAAVVRVPLERAVRVADGADVDVAAARGRRGVDRERGLGALPTRQHDVAAERRRLAATGGRRSLRRRERGCEHSGAGQHGQQQQTSHRSRPPERDSHNPIQACASRTARVIAAANSLQTRQFSTDESVSEPLRHIRRRIVSRSGGSGSRPRGTGGAPPPRDRPGGRAR